MTVDPNLHMPSVPVMAAFKRFTGSNAIASRFLAGPTSQRLSELLHPPLLHFTTRLSLKRLAGPRLETHLFDDQLHVSRALVSSPLVTLGLLLPVWEAKA